MKKKYLIGILIVIAFIFCVNGCNKSSSNIENYLKSGTQIDSNAKDVMPNLDDLPKYKDIAYRYTHKSIYIFQSDSVALIVKYDDKTYKSEKDKLDKKYTFLDQKDGWNFHSIIPEYKFSINSYNFRVAAGNEKDNTNFPKSFGMIGTSDKEKSIAYLYFYDQDLDYIAEEDDKNPMANFVKKYFKYNF